MPMYIQPNNRIKSPSIRRKAAMNTSASRDSTFACISHRRRHGLQCNELGEVLQHVLLGCGEGLLQSASDLRLHFCFARVAALVCLVEWSDTAGATVSLAKGPELGTRRKKYEILVNTVSKIVEKQTPIVSFVVGCGVFPVGLFLNACFLGLDVEHVKQNIIIISSSEGSSVPPQQQKQQNRCVVGM